MAQPFAFRAKAGDFELLPCVVVAPHRRVMRIAYATRHSRAGLQYAAPSELAQRSIDRVEFDEGRSRCAWARCAYVEVYYVLLFRIAMTANAVLGRMPAIDRYRLSFGEGGRRRWSYINA